jgi:hypothetical protein
MMKKKARIFFEREKREKGEKRRQEKEEAGEKRRKGGMEETAICS